MTLLWKKPKTLPFSKCLAILNKTFANVLKRSTKPYECFDRKMTKKSLMNKALIMTKLRMRCDHNPSFIVPSNQPLLLNLSCRALRMGESSWGTMMISVLVAFIFLMTTTALYVVGTMMIIIFSLMVSWIYHVSYAVNSVTIIEWIFIWWWISYWITTMFMMQFFIIIHCIFHSC